MRNVTLLILLTAALAVLIPSASSATEEFARNTGLACSACHQDPRGGGALTTLGEQFGAALSARGLPAAPGPFKKAARLVMGYLHILAGVVWFGTIFYVHILLKPAYAAKGLPKGELTLGWVCIIVVGITGSALTYERIHHSSGALLASRFGILLSIKIFLYLVMASSAAVVTFVLGPRMKRRIAASKESSEGEFTPEELKSFDGQEGRKTFVALDGIVYDMDSSRPWKNGKHARHLAGEDLTEAIKQAPHGVDKLEGFPSVGRLVPERVKPRANRPKAVFYFIAYMNLAMIFLVLAVIALWRWW